MQNITRLWSQYSDICLLGVLILVIAFLNCILKRKNSKGNKDSPKTAKSMEQMISDYNQFATESNQLTADIYRYMDVICETLNIYRGTPEDKFVEEFFILDMAVQNTLSKYMIQMTRIKSDLDSFICDDSTWNARNEAECFLEELKSAKKKAILLERKTHLTDQQKAYYSNLKQQHYEREWEQEKERYIKSFASYNPYENLTFFSDCKNQDDVEITYKKLIKKLHPDNNNGKADDFLQMKEEYEKIKEEAAHEKDLV